MEKPSRNLNVPKSDSEATIVFDDDAAEKETDDLVSTLPLKPQDRYKFIRSIGFGGMKGVLLVHDRDTGRDVAMAIMPDFRDRPVHDLNRFVQEARITAKLEHPNIVRGGIVQCEMKYDRLLSVGGAVVFNVLRHECYASRFCGERFFL